VRTRGSGVDYAMNWIGLVGIVALPAAFSIILAIRHLERRQQNCAESWPMVMATIEWGVETHLIPTRRYNALLVCLLPYSYCANGSYFAGKLALEAEDDAEARQFGARLKGRNIMVRYDPARPEISIPTESNLDGHPVLEPSAVTKWVRRAAN